MEANHGRNIRFIHRQDHSIMHFSEICFAYNQRIELYTHILIPKFLLDSFSHQVGQAELYQHLEEQCSPSITVRKIAVLKRWR